MIATEDRIQSVILGRDPEVLQTMLEFYARPDGVIVDVTANRRKMWKNVDLPDEQKIIFTDIDPEVQPDITCDFRKLPFDDNSIALLVFDPPHLPAAAGSPRSLSGYKTNYGLERSAEADNINEFFPPFLQEALRVLKDDGLVFCKLRDYVHNHKYQWTLAKFISEVQLIEGLTPCDLIIKRDPAGGNLKSGRWKKAYHARSVHTWWIVVRKGRCEPRKK